MSDELYEGFRLEEEEELDNSPTGEGDDEETEDEDSDEEGTDDEESM